MRIIMTAPAPLECRHPRLGQSLWRLGVMRPQCLHAHAAPAGVLVCPAGRPGEVSLPSVASSPCASGGAGSGCRAPLVRAPPPPHRRVLDASLGGWGLSPLPPTRCPLAGSARPQAAQCCGGSPRGRGAHRRHPRVPLVPSGTAVPYPPVCQQHLHLKGCTSHPGPQYLHPMREKGYLINLIKPYRVYELSNRQKMVPVLSYTNPFYYFFFDILQKKSSHWCVPSWKFGKAT